MLFAPDRPTALSISWIFSSIFYQIMRYPVGSCPFFGPFLALDKIFSFIFLIFFSSRFIYSWYFWSVVWVIFSISASAYPYFSLIMQQFHVIPFPFPSGFSIYPFRFSEFSHTPPSFSRQSLPWFPLFISVPEFLLYFYQASRFIF